MRYLRDGEGRCSTRQPGQGELVVRHLASGARTVLPTYVEDGSAYYRFGRPDFTADGRSVQYSVWQTCLEQVVRYSVSARTQRAVEWNGSCEGGDAWRETAATPSGGIAVVYSYAGEPWGPGNGGTCLRVPTGHRCVEEFGRGWSRIDVQPRR